MTEPTPQAIFETLPGHFLPEVAGTTKTTIAVVLTGKDGGRWWVRIADGACEVGTGPAEGADATLTADAADYIQIRLGHLDPMAALMKGRLKVEGKYGHAIKFSKMFRTGA